MKNFKSISIIFVLLFSWTSFAQKCAVTTNTGCKNTEVCMNWDKNETKCVEIPPMSDQVFILPFDKNTEVVCTHARGIGSHSWPNAFWALDLATPYDSKASVVRAAAPGKAFIFFAKDGEPCENPKGTPEKSEPDDCGHSWGNRVKVLHENGYYSFYVHLEKIMVKDGQQVSAGTPLGIEGWTGAAGHRHLHWSLQKIGGDTDQDREANLKQWDGMSTPFKFRSILNGKESILDTSIFNCEHANVGAAIGQPSLRGIE